MKMYEAPSKLALPDADDADFAQVVQRLLRAVREHLGLDVAFVGEVTEDERVFRYVDTGASIDVVAPGGADPLDSSYCGHVLSGRLPEFLLDPGEHPVAASMAVTEELPVGTHLSIPIEFSDGQVYGTFCCFAFDVRHDLTEKDLRAVRMIAELAGEYLEAMHVSRAAEEGRRAAIQALLDQPGSVEVVFQPLWDLEAVDVVAVEALARFPGHTTGPHEVFADAAAAGLGVELELVALRRALEVLDRLPAPVRLNLNVSPETLVCDDFFEAVAPCPRGRLVIEVTEHAVVEDYTEMRLVSQRLTEAGIRLAIDDVGMGFSGLNRILQTEPEELKLDAFVIRDIHISPVKQALVEAFCAFGRRVGFQLVAEGIERPEELHMLRELGAGFGQGFLLGRPGTLDQALSARWPG